MDFSGAIPVVRRPNADCVNCWLGNLLSSFPVIPKTSSLHHESIGPTVVNPIPEAAVQLSELIPDAIVECMATCHNIALYAEDRLVGEMKMKYTVNPTM